MKNEISYIEGVCPTIEETRKQVCSPTCVRGDPAPCSVQGPDVLVAPQVAAGTVNGVYTLTTVRKLPRLVSGGCPVTSSTIQSGYHYLRINNPGTEPVNVTVTMSAPPAGAKADLYVAGYIGLSAPPADAAARQACDGTVKDSPENLTMNIPAGQAAFVLSMGSSASTTGKFTAEVKTNFVGAELPPMPQYTIAAASAVSGVVNQAIAFSADTLPRPTGLLGLEPCPLTLSSSDTSYSYIRVNNPDAVAHTVTLATTGGTDTLLAYYNGNAPLSTNRTACTGNWIEDGIDETLAGAVIPAGGAITVYVGRYSGTGGTSNLRVYDHELTHASVPLERAPRIKPRGSCVLVARMS